MAKAKLKKVQMSSVTTDVISMEFDQNPNIATANYSAETAKRVQQAIIKKMRVDKLKQFIDTELKEETRNSQAGEHMGFEFSFKSM